MRRRDSGAVEIDLAYVEERRTKRVAAPAVLADPLFDPVLTDHGAGDLSPVEHAGRRPQPKPKGEAPPTLILLCETEEERDALLDLLGLPVNRRGAVWEAQWPPSEDDADPALRFDL